MNGLFDKTQLGSMKLKNRIFMSPMGTTGEADGSYCIEGINYFEERAKGGAGLIYTGAYQPDFQFDNGVVMNNPFRKPGVFLSRHKKLADRVHCYGAKLFIQLAYGCGRVDFPAWIAGNQGVAPSCCTNRWNPSIKHRALKKEEIDGMISASIEAAKLCCATGCDGMDINCYGGYLADQFLQPCYNKRDDEYGGLEGGILFMSRIAQGIKSALGKNFPLTCRLGVRQYIKAPRETWVEGGECEEYGRTPEQSLYVAKALVNAGYDAIYLGNGTYDSFYSLLDKAVQKRQEDYLAVYRDFFSDLKNIRAELQSRTENAAGSAAEMAELFALESKAKELMTSTLDKLMQLDLDAAASKESKKKIG